MPAFLACVPLLRSRLCVSFVLVFVRVWSLLCLLFSSLCGILVLVRGWGGVVGSGGPPRSVGLLFSFWCGSAVGGRSAPGPLLAGGWVGVRLLAVPSVVGWPCGGAPSRFSLWCRGLVGRGGGAASGCGGALLRSGGGCRAPLRPAGPLRFSLPFSLGRPSLGGWRWSSVGRSALGRVRGGLGGVRRSGCPCAGGFGSFRCPVALAPARSCGRVGAGGCCCGLFFGCLGCPCFRFRFRLFRGCCLRRLFLPCCGCSLPRWVGLRAFLPRCRALCRRRFCAGRRPCRLFRLARAARAG